MIDAGNTGVPARPAYPFIVPKLAIFAVFLLVPIGWAWLLSLQSGQILGGFSFTGLDNFRRVFSDGLFWTSLRHSLLYVVLIIPASIVLALALAALLNRRVRLRSTFGALIILPALTSPVAASVIWVYVLQTRGGVLNGLLGVVGLGPVNWLGTPELTIPVISLVEIWRSVPFFAILFLAGMQSIPTQLYDAATIDGASPFQAYRKVTLPLMRPIILFATLMSSIWTLQIFDTPQVMTKGGPADASLSVVQYVYRTAFQFDALGMAAAMSLVLLALILVLALAQFKLLHRETEY